MIPALPSYPPMGGRAGSSEGGRAVLIITGPLPQEAAVQPGSFADRLAEIDLSGTEWMADGACGEVDGDLWFPPKGFRGDEARFICRSCEVRAQCLEYALKVERGTGRQLRFGIYGGMTPEQRWLLDKSRRQTKGRKVAA